MAKFCGNCGMQLDDAARICGYCGTPLDGAESASASVFVDPEKKKQSQKKIKNTVKLIIGVVALVVVAVIVFNTITSFTGYNGLLRKVMNAYEDYDIDALLEMSSDIYYYNREDDSYAENYFESKVGYALDYFESYVGHSYDLSYEVEETYTLSKRGMDSTLEALSWISSDFDASIIEEIVVAEVILTAEQDDVSKKMTIKITMTNEDGAWRLLYIEN